MKALKAGPILGIAMADYNGSDIGQLMVFVKTGFYNGANLTDIVTAADQKEFGREVLNYFITQKEKLTATPESLNLSDILADRVAAGIDIISPQITAQNLTVAEIKPLEKELLITLSDNSEVKIASNSSQPVITFDSSGNAFFAGTVIADKIQAGQILGLEIITDNISSLSGRLDSFASVSPNPALNTNSAVESIFDKLVIFLNNVIFKGKVTFEQSPEFDRDTAGFALVKKGQKRIDIKFEKEFSDSPIINVNPLWTLDAGTASVADQLDGFFPYFPRYVITNISKSGFTIILEEKATMDIKFNWLAIFAKDAKTHESEDNQVVLENLVSPTEDPAVFTPTLFLSPSPSTTPALQITATPAISPAVIPTPTTNNQKLTTVSVLPTELGFVRLRKGPTTSSAEIGQVPQGTQLEYESIENDWYHVSYNEIKGWISGTYISSLTI